jgi:hypothetical protein
VLEDSCVTYRPKSLVSCEKLGHCICPLANALRVRHSEGTVQQLERLVLVSREISESHGITGEPVCVIKMAGPNMKHCNA